MTDPVLPGVTNSFPNSWPSVLPNGLQDTSASALARDFVSFLYKGITVIGLDIWVVVIPFLIACTVISYAFGKIGISMTGMGNQLDAAEEDNLRHIRQYGSLPNGGRGGAL